MDPCDEQKCPDDTCPPTQPPQDQVRELQSWEPGWTCPIDAPRQRFTMPSVLFNLIDRNTREQKEEERALKVAKIKSDKKLLKEKMDKKKYKPPPPTPTVRKGKSKIKIQKVASQTLLLPIPTYDEYYGEGGETLLNNPNPSLESINPKTEEEEGIKIINEIEASLNGEPLSDDISIAEERKSLSVDSKLSVKSKDSKANETKGKSKSRHTSGTGKSKKEKHAKKSSQPVISPKVSKTASKTSAVEESSEQEHSALEVEHEGENLGEEYIGESDNTRLSLPQIEIVSPEEAEEQSAEMEEEEKKVDLHALAEQRYAERLEIFNEISSCQKITRNDVSYVFALRRSHSEPSLMRPLNPILGVSSTPNYLKSSTSMENIVLSQDEYPSLMLKVPKIPGSSRVKVSELKKIYDLSPEAAQAWVELKEARKKRFSFFDELFAKGMVVDSMEVPGRMDDVDYLVEADQSALRAKVDYARVVLKTKHVYTGNMKNWYFEGPGRYTWADGTIYQGEFKQGVMHGEGVILSPDGSIYEGAFKNGKRVGWGIYSHAKGYLYAGDWKEGVPHGNGKVWYDPNSENDYYYGQFQEGQLHGTGTRQYGNGDRYIGEWKDGIRWGKGTMIWLAERQVYKGNWESGIPNGKGEHIWYLGRTNNSYLVSRNVYKGDFVNGMRHGIGRYVYACGSVYEGQWHNGQRHNKGVYINPAGEPLFGLFRFGTIVGGEAIPLHTPTYYCEFEALIETLTVEFGLNHRVQESEHLSVTQVIIKYISELRQLFKRAGYLGQCFGKQGVFPSWLQKPPKEPINKNVPKVREPFIFDPPIDPNSPDNVNPLTRFGLWLLLRDCPGILQGFTLAEFDRLWNSVATISFETRHHPFESVFLWQFFQCLVVVAVVVVYELPRRKQKFAALQNEEETGSVKFAATVKSEESLEHDTLAQKKKKRGELAAAAKSKATIAKSKKKGKKLKSGKSKVKAEKSRIVKGDLSSNSMEYEEGDAEEEEEDTEVEEEQEEASVKSSMATNITTITREQTPEEETDEHEMDRDSELMDPNTSIRISVALEYVLINYFIPCLSREPGFNLPTVPEPLPPLGDLYNAFLNLYPENPGLVDGNEFLLTMLPPHVPSPRSEGQLSELGEDAFEHTDGYPEPSYNQQSSATVSHYPISVSIAPLPVESIKDKFIESDDFLGGRPSIGEVFAELADKARRRRSRGMSIIHRSETMMAPPSTAVTSYRDHNGSKGLLKTNAIRKMSRRQMIQEGIGSQNTIDYTLEEEDGEEADDDFYDYDDNSDSNLLHGIVPLNDDELPAEPFLWERELTCKFDKESVKPLTNINERDIIRVLRKLFPNIHGGLIGLDMNFELTFADWLLGIAMLAKLSTDRLVYASITKQSEFDHISRIPHNLPRYNIYYFPNDNNLTELPPTKPSPESCLDKLPTIPNSRPQNLEHKQEDLRKSLIEEMDRGESAIFDYGISRMTHGMMKKHNPSEAGSEFSFTEENKEIEDVDEEGDGKTDISEWHSTLFGHKKKPPSLLTNIDRKM